MNMKRCEDQKIPCKSQKRVFLKGIIAIPISKYSMDIHQIKCYTGGRHSDKDLHPFHLSIKFWHALHSYCYINHNEFFPFMSVSSYHTFTFISFFWSETIKKVNGTRRKRFLFIRYHKHVNRIGDEWKRWIKGLKIKKVGNI